MRGVQPKERHPHTETQWWGYYAVGMLQSGISDLIKVEDIPHAVSSKTGFGSHFFFLHNSEHALLLVKNYPQKIKVNVTDWPAQSLT